VEEGKWVQRDGKVKDTFQLPRTQQVAPRDGDCRARRHAEGGRCFGHGGGAEGEGSLVILGLPPTLSFPPPDSNTLKRDIALTFLSGMILTFWTCPVVSKICFNTSSVQRGSSPPTYSARLFGSGAARRTYPPALVGDIILPDMGEVMAVGIGFVFCGMTTGGRGGGGMWD
jgi:hypothetical protein